MATTTPKFAPFEFIDEDWGLLVDDTTGIVALAFCRVEVALAILLLVKCLVSKSLLRIPTGRSVEVTDQRHWPSQWRYVWRSSMWWNARRVESWRQGLEYQIGRRDSCKSPVFRE